MSALAHRLDRTVIINAPREAVWRYVSDSSRWANFWGAGSTIDSRPGGKVHIRYPEGTEVAGDVLDVKPAERIVFTYGYVSGKPIAPGSSRVTIELAEERGATRLTLTHELFDVWAEPDASAREATLARIAAADVQFRDRFGNINGLAELHPHIAAAQHFMPGLRLKRSGEIRHCQGTVLADYAVVGPDGAERATGTSVFALGQGGRIVAATSFMNPRKPA